MCCASRRFLLKDFLPGQPPADTSVDDLLGDLLAVRDARLGPRLGQVGDVGLMISSYLGGGFLNIIVISSPKIGGR